MGQQKGSVSVARWRWERWLWLGRRVWPFLWAAIPNRHREWLWRLRILRLVQI